MAELEVLRIEQVARRLNVPLERWGWEFHEPVAVRPYATPKPRWSEPPPPYLPTHDEKYLRARAAMTKRIVITAAVLLVGLAGATGPQWFAQAIRLTCVSGALDLVVSQLSDRLEE